MNKKELIENSIFNKFRKSYEKFPSGKIKHIDKPDFIIYGDKKVGVEITQIFKDDQESEKGSLLKSVEEFRKKVSEETLSLLREKQSPKCWLEIHLNVSEFPTQKSPKETAQVLYKDINKNIRAEKKDYILEVENNSELPSIVDSYEVIFNQKIKEYEYIESGSVIGGIIDNKRIQFILDKKEVAKENFLNCDEYWLVIKSGEFIADYFPAMQINSEELNTTFNKVFILKYLENETIEIK